MSRISFGFGVSPGEPVALGAELARAERLGYDRAGIWDSPALFREPWTTLGAVARDTTRIRLGTWVTNPRSRHPAVTAAAAATLDDLAPGRAYVGIGTGGTGAWHLGLTTAPLGELEAYVRALRGLLAGGRARHGDADLSLDWPGRRHVPVLVSAHAERSLRVAGRIGDGVVVGLGVSPDIVAASLERIDAGARESGRTLADLEVWFTSFWWVDEEPGRALAEGAWSATAFAHHFAASGVRGKLVPPDLRDALLEVARGYDLRTHGHPGDEQKAAYVERAERLGVADYLRRRFVLAGTPDEVEAQIRAAHAAGASRFDGALDADLPEHEERVTRWARLVLPRF